MTLPVLLPLVLPGFGPNHAGFRSGRPYGSVSVTAVVLGGLPPGSSQPFVAISSGRRSASGEITWSHSPCRIVVETVILRSTSVGRSVHLGSASRSSGCVRLAVSHRRAPRAACLLAAGPRDTPDRVRRAHRDPHRRHAPGRGGRPRDPRRAGSNATASGPRSGTRAPVDRSDRARRRVRPDVKAAFACFVPPPRRR